MRGGRGRGRGRGRPDDVAATASGPFSLGPAAQGKKKARLIRYSLTQSMSLVLITFLSLYFNCEFDVARSRAIVTGGGSASGAHSSYTGVQAMKYEGGEGGSDYGAFVDMKFGSTVTDASVPTGLEKPNEDTKKAVGTSIKEEKMRGEDMESDEQGKRSA